MRSSDWSSDVCASDLRLQQAVERDPLRADEHRGRQALPFKGRVGWGWVCSRPGHRRGEVDPRAPGRGQRRGRGTLRQLPLRPARAGAVRIRLERGLRLVRGTGQARAARRRQRSEEHTSELQSLMRISYAVFCLNKKQKTYHLIHSTLIKKTKR